MVMTILLLFSIFAAAGASPGLDPAEQEAAYLALEAASPGVEWRSLYPDDLCFSGPRAVVCDYFDVHGGAGAGDGTVHVTELYFGPLSSYYDNVICSSDAAFVPPAAWASFRYLRKLFYYRCFVDRPIAVPGHLWNASTSLEELHFVDNPSLVGTVDGKVGDLTFLCRVVISGTGLSGLIPDTIGKLGALEQLVMTRSRFKGHIPTSIGELKELKVLDLSFNRLGGSIPTTLGYLPNLLKLDLSYNTIAGELPNDLAGLERLEFLDLSYNSFSNSGIPLFMAAMVELKQVHLSGNRLGGPIPEISSKLGNIQGLGLSGLGLVGAIPTSMVISLTSAAYIGLDNNELQGEIPSELGRLVSLKEMNLENNKLTGELKLPDNFSARVRVAGNDGLCVPAAEVGGSTVAVLGGRPCSDKTWVVLPRAASDVLPYSSSSSVHALISGSCFLLVCNSFLFLF